MEKPHFLETTTSPIAGTSWTKTLLVKRDDSLFLLVRKDHETFPPIQDSGLISWLTQKGLAGIVDLSTGKIAMAAFGVLEGALRVSELYSPDWEQETRPLLRDTPPPDFFLCFRWGEGEKGLERCIEPPAAYLGRGWFFSPQAIWRVAGVEAEDDRWLQSPVLAGEGILSLLQTAIPHWRERGLPFSTDLRLGTQPPFHAEILRVESDRITLRLHWLTSGEVMAELPGLPGYLLVDDVVCPGWRPVDFSSVFAEEAPADLVGEEIPHFLRTLPDPTIWAEGEVKALAHFHQVILDPGRPILEIRRGDCTGIGGAFAVPTIAYPQGIVEASDLLSSAPAEEEYLPSPIGWIARETFPKSWQEGGAPTDGTFLQPITLNPEEILRRGSMRLAGAWTEVCFPSLQQAEGELPLEVATRHMEFLRSWGLPGGLLGTVPDLAPSLHAFLQSAFASFPDFRALVVGSRTALHFLTPAEEPFDPVRLRRVSPPELEENPSLSSSPWSLLLLLDADLLVRSPSSSLYRQLLHCPRRLTMGTFRRSDFLKRALPRTALSRLFGIGSYSNLWKYTLRQPDLPPPTLPPLYSFPSPTQTQTSILPELILPERPVSSGIPIPPRPGMTSPEEVRFSSPLVEEVWQRRSSHFLEDALDLATAWEEGATFVPFAKSFPTYSDMERGQLKWYLTWRNRVRKGEYLPTDAGYITLLAYEWINQVGVEDPMEGFQALRQLWLAYRTAFPALDEFLVDWLADYLLVYGLPLDPFLVYREAFPLLGRLRDPDLAFSLFLEEPWERWPLQAIELALEYRLRWTEFWVHGGGELLERWVPRALAEIERVFQAEDGRGILVRYRPREPRSITRYPFQGARYRGELRLLEVATVWPYPSHLPLRQFFTAVTQAVENILRHVRGFPLQERTLPLPASLLDRIEGFLPHQAGALTPMQAPQPNGIRLDPDRIKHLEAEIGPLQALLAPLPEEEEKAEPIIVAASSSSLPEVRDLLHWRGVPEEWAAFGQQLRLYQVRTLWAILDLEDPSFQLSAIAQEQALLPELLLDGINELALDTIGDFVLEPGADPPCVEEEQRETLRRVLAMIRPYAC